MNPIIGRELLEALRTRKALALQVGLALACALLVLVRWPTEDVVDLNGARALEVLRFFGYGLLAGVLLLTPAFPATSLVREKIKGTLALLFNSPLRPWSIYAGKLAGALGFTAVLLAMTTPAAAACYVLGGTTSQWGVAELYVVLALAALQVAALGLLVSSRAQSTDGALRVTYALVLAVCVLPLVPYQLLQLLGDSPFKTLAAVLRCLSPVPAVMEVLGQADAGSQGVSAGSAAGLYALLLQGRFGEAYAHLSAGGGAAELYAPLALAFSLVCAVLTVRRLNHTLLDRARPAGVMTQDRTAGQQLLRRILYLVDPQRRAAPISGWVNPVMVKEFRTRRFGRWHWVLRLLALSAILSLAVALAALTEALGLGPKYIAGGLVLLQIALLLLFAPSLGAGLVSAERESGSWQLLRMTPLRPGAILRGKLMSVGLPLLLLFFATLTGYSVLITIDPLIGPELQFERAVFCLIVAGLVIGAFLAAMRGGVPGLAAAVVLLAAAGVAGWHLFGTLGPVTALRLQRMAACLALTAVFVVLVSAAAGTLFRSTAAAMTASYVAILAVCVAPFLVWQAQDAPFTRPTVEAVLLVDPVAAALQAADVPEFKDYALLPANWWIIGGACVALLAFLRLRVWQLCRPE
jgi:ABC-type transport system involved in multi-copper enzyme maturation permease subunit